MNWALTGGYCLRAGDCRKWSQVTNVTEGACYNHGSNKPSPPLQVDAKAIDSNWIELCEFVKRERNRRKGRCSALFGSSTSYRKWRTRLNAILLEEGCSFFASSSLQVHWGFCCRVGWRCWDRTGKGRGDKRRERYTPSLDNSRWRLIYGSFWRRRSKNGNKTKKQWKTTVDMERKRFVSF